MAIQTNVTVPYGIFAITNETDHITITDKFDTERCILPRIAIHGATKLTVNKDIDTNFDTYLRVRGDTKNRRFAFVMR